MPAFTMTKYDRYLKLVAWANGRYARPDGFVILSIGKKPSRYSLIEDMAAAKILGCRRRYPDVTLRTAI